MKEASKNIEPVAAAEKISETLNKFEFANYLPKSWQPYWEKLQSIPFLEFFILLVVGYVLGKILAVVFSKGLGKIGKRTTNQYDDKLVKLLKRPLFLTIFLFFVGLGVKTLPISSDTDIALLRILASIVVLMWGVRSFSILTNSLNSLSQIKEKFDIIQPKTIPLFEIIGKVLVIVISSYILLILWGINPTAWLASAGVIGIAVGFAAKDTLANLFSGFFILIDSPYKVGDYINLDSGERGQVTHVGLRSTRLLTRDDVEITVPNNVIGNTKIVNESGGHWEKCRIRIKVGVAYGSDLQQVCEVLQGIALSHDDVIKDPEPRVRMRAFGASSIDFELLLWIPQPVLRGRISHEIYMTIYNEFNRLSIEIPYSKHDVYIKQMPK